jgi:primosomal protein N' (replication factor Y)
VQTYQPENYAVQSAAAQDYQAFYRREMAFRRRQADPPYSKLIRLLYAHRNAAQCEGDAIRLSDSLREQRDAWGMSDVDLLGPVPAFPARLRGMYRWQIVLRGPEPRLLLDKASVPTGWQVDMDPVSLS